jgi:hypothetical protein
LTPRQRQAVPFFAGQPTVEGACRAARVAKATAYAWLRVPAFERDAAAAREEIATHALGALKTRVAGAVETITVLAAEGRSEGVRLAAAKAVVEHAVKTRELDDLEARLKAIEEQVSQGRGRWAT